MYKFIFRERERERIRFFKILQDKEKNCKEFIKKIEESSYIYIVVKFGKFSLYCFKRNFYIEKFLCVMDINNSV